MKSTVISLIALSLLAPSCRQAATPEANQQQQQQPQDPGPYGPGSRLTIGNIDPSGISTRVIVGPDTVRAGQSVAFTINTFGSSCLRPESTAVTQSAQLAVVTPFDRSPGPNYACTADYGTRPHPVSLRFTAAGTATVRVRGMVFAQSGARLDSITRAVIVLP